MSDRSALAFCLGTASAVLLGYCIYFDQKRRSDPEYKKKVHRRREQQELKLELEKGKTLMSMLDLNAEGEMQQTLCNVIGLGEQLISQGYVSEGLNHLASALIMCAQPAPIVQALRTSMPEHVQTLMLRLQELQEAQQSSGHSEYSSYQYSTATSSVEASSSQADVS